MWRLRVTHNLVDVESSDDDLYAWFVRAMAEEFGAADEVRPHVVHVWSVVDGETDPAPYELRVTRQQLRSVAEAANPGQAGLDAFTFDVQESMDSGWKLSRTYEFDGGRMRRLNRH